MRYPQNTVSPGWSLTKIAGGLQGVRTIVFDPLGNMLVSEARKGISVHTFGEDGCIASSELLIQDIALNHGLDLTPDGTTLYASSVSSVWSWAYDPATRTVSDQRTVINGMSTGIHPTRTVLVVPQQPELVLIQVGSNSNLDMQSAQPGTGRAIVKVFDMSAAPANGYNYNTGGEVFAYGLRNDIGLTADPNGMIWGVENSGDVSLEEMGERLWKVLGALLTRGATGYQIQRCRHSYRQPGRKVELPYAPFLLFPLL